MSYDSRSDLYYESEKSPDAAKLEIINRIRNMVYVIANERYMKHLATYHLDGSLSVYIEKHSNTTQRRLNEAGMEFYILKPGVSPLRENGYLEVIVPANAKGLAQTLKGMEKIIVQEASSGIFYASKTFPEDRRDQFKKRVLEEISKKIGLDSPNTGKSFSR